MARDQAFAAIDVGTSKVCTLVADINDHGEVVLLGAGVADSRGLRKGIVVNLEDTVQSIRDSVSQAERASGIRINSAHVGIAGGHVGSMNNRGVVAIGRSDRIITEDDVIRVMESARTVQIPSNREILHVIPRAYTLDGQTGVRNPLGMHGLRLDVEAHIVTGATTSIQNLTKCVERAGVEVEELVLQPLASGEAVLTREEREMGVMVADIGGGTTDVAIYIDGTIWHTAILPIGGFHLTNDLVIGMRVPYPAAEEIKRRYGHAVPAMVDVNDRIDPAEFGLDDRILLRQHIAELLQDRCRDVFAGLQEEMMRSGYRDMLPAGLVITGGTANLRGIEVAARNHLQMPVRIGHPRGIKGVTAAVDDPSYATAAGLLIWSLRYTEVEVRKPQGTGLGDALRRVRDLIRDLVPA